MGRMGLMGGMRDIPWEGCECGMMDMGGGAKTPKATGERLELRKKLLEMRGEMMKAAAAVMERYAKELEHCK